MKPKATRIEPVLEAEVDSPATTGDGLLREAVFKGLPKGSPRLAGVWRRELMGRPYRDRGSSQAKVKCPDQSDFRYSSSAAFSLCDSPVPYSWPQRLLPELMAVQSVVSRSWSKRV